MFDFDKRRKQFDLDFEKTKRQIRIMWGVSIVLGIAFWGTVIFVAYRILVHFGIF